MFSMITNIYNKKTKRPTLTELFTAAGRLKKFFLITRDFRFLHHGWNGTNQYNIQVLARHAWTWVYRYSSLLHWYSLYLSEVTWQWWDDYPVFDINPPPQNKSQGVMSGELGRQSISGWSFPDHGLFNVLVTLCSGGRTSHWTWAGLPSCWYTNCGMFCNCGISHIYNMSSYAMPVTVSSAKKNGPYTFWLEIAINTLALGESRWCPT